MLFSHAFDGGILRVRMVGGGMGGGMGEGWVKGLVVRVVYYTVQQKHSVLYHQ